jgi:hypothetical protein
MLVTGTGSRSAARITVAMRHPKKQDFHNEVGVRSLNCLTNDVSQNILVGPLVDQVQ